MVSVQITIPEGGMFPSKQLMQVYQMDVARNPKAYLDWEFKVENTDCWCDLTDHPCWVSMIRYRRKSDYTQ